MCFKKTLCLVVVSVSFFCSSMANASYYGGAILSYSSAEYTASAGAENADGNPFVLQAQVGRFFNDYIALEGRYGLSTGRSDGISIDSLASILVRANLPVSEQTAMYALVGASSAKLNQQNVGSSTESGTSFGLGVHYAFDSSRAMTIEYLSSLNKDKTKVAGLSLAFQYRF